MSVTSGFGTTIGVSDDGATYTLLAEIIDTIDGPERRADAIETTSHDSTNGIRTYIGGLKDNGELGFKLNWDPGSTTHTKLAAARGALKHWQITYPGGDTSSFEGVLTSFKPSAPIDDRMTAEVTVQVSGAITDA